KNPQAPPSLPKRQPKELPLLPRATSALTDLPKAPPKAHPQITDNLARADARMAPDATPLASRQLLPQLKNQASRATRASDLCLPLLRRRGISASLMCRRWKEKPASTTLIWLRN